MLLRPDMHQFAQRVAVDFHIKPFDASDVKNYIQHRLAIAGRDTPLFTDAACNKIAEAARGVPRSINSLCDTALVYGFSAGSERIGMILVEEVLQDKAEFGALPESV